jgi:hypothetical protein
MPHCEDVHLSLGRTHRLAERQSDVDGRELISDAVAACAASAAVAIFLDSTCATETSFLKAWLNHRRDHDA